ncbi:MAG: ABC transporter ATP-binding protein [Chloroflexota bacterium]
MRTLLELRAVSRHFGGLMAVNSVSLAVAEGEIVGLIGPNGAGKTTLFAVVSGFYQPTAGNVFFDGKSIVGLRPDAICSLGLTRTFQLVQPFPRMTVLENVMVGAFKRTSSRRQAEAQAWETLEFVGLAPKGNQRASSLTTPDRKRLEVARSLATKPRLLLLDEVMSGLTPTESMHMVGLIKKIRERGTTLLVIEHVMRAIMSLSDRIVVLHHGQLIAEGHPREIACDQAVIEAYLGEEFLLADSQAS